MTTMTRSRIAAVIAGLAVAVLLAACGGGGPDPGAGKGDRVTDPAKVPSSTPIQNPVLYQIRSDGRVDSSGGPPTTVSPNSTATGTAGATYTVASGDTCGAIVAKYNITLDALRKSNRTIDDGCTNLHAGDVLKIPSAAAPTGTAVANGTAKPGGSGKTYTVASGDTCGSIAAQYGVTTAALISANGIDSQCLNLKVGQVLTIPASSG
jgi:LysM repeat protein